MPPTKPRTLPPHGTRARYRIEIKPGADGERGKPCDRCKAANSQASRDQRANRDAARARSRFTIVEDAETAETVDASVDAPADASTSSRNRELPRRQGSMEAAVEADIAEIDTALQVPFHRTLSELARKLAREIDEPATPAAARSSSSRQLFEVLRSLRTQREGDDDSAVAAALQAVGFGVPVVP